MRQAVVLVAALLACKSRVEVRADPTDAARDTSPPIEKHVIARAGEVIDLDGASMIRVLREGAVIAEVNDDHRAFLFGRDFMLRAFELTTGKEVWKKSIPATFRPLVHDRRFVYALGDSIVTVFAKETGEARTITLAKPYGHVTTLNGRLVVSRNDHAIDVIDPVSGTAVTALTLAFDVIGWWSGLQTLPDDRTVCAIGGDAKLQIVCFDGSGTIKTRATVDLSRGAPGVFGVAWFDSRYVLYAAHDTTKVRRSAVLRLSDGAVLATVEDRVAAIVERENGDIAGLLVVDPELRMLELSGATRWTAKSAVGHHEGASAIARGDRVFIDTFPGFSSGSHLEARELATGALVWTAVVEALPIGHSEYFNDVRLSLVGNRVVLRGDESAVTTTQLFDIANGNRDLARSHHR
jgi:hypothetical protein